MLKKININNFEESSKIYFKEIGKFTPLTKEEEFSLWEKYKKNNDLNARDRLIKSNLKFVASVVRNYQGLGLSYADLIAEGNYGLMKAMDKFDYTKGYKTISYSIWWIKQTILEALKDRGALKGEELPNDFEYQGSFEGDEYDSDLTIDEAYIEPENDLFKLDEIKKTTANLISCLSPKELYVISEYFGINRKKSLTLEEIGTKLGLTKERIRQIKEKSLIKLRYEALKNAVTSDIYK